MKRAKQRNWREPDPWVKYFQPIAFYGRNTDVLSLINGVLGRIDSFRIYTGETNGISQEK